MRKILIAQGGAPTVVINQTLVGIVLQARLLGVPKVLGALHGVRGIAREEFVDLARESADDLERVAATPGSALGTTRDKPDSKYCSEILKVLQAHGIDCFLYIGGEDTARTLDAVRNEAHTIGYPLRCIHVPKTIDSDLVGNDHTPGYPSAARFIVQAFVGLNLDNKALPGAHVVVVMGRNTGWLTAASVMARKHVDDGPHLVYLPERAFDVRAFLTEVKAAYDRHGRCLIAVSEGIRDVSGTLMLKRLAEVQDDQHGHARLSGTGVLADYLCQKITTELAIGRVCGDTLGYPQRSFLGCVSHVDSREARNVGEKAAQYAIEADSDGSVVIERISGLKYYAVRHDLLPLQMVAGKTKVMPDHFISEAGVNVTRAFERYLQPLLGADMPNVHRLQSYPVEKVLKT